MYSFAPILRKCLAKAISLALDDVVTVGAASWAIAALVIGEENVTTENPVILAIASPTEANVEAVR